MVDVVLDPKILKKMIFIDTTSFSVTGKHYNDKGSVKLTKGYSKDYRADLKQLVYLLVSSQDGIPILGECYSGNTVDNFVFQQKIVQIQNLILDDLEGSALVLDSSLYSKQFLRNEWITGDWIEDYSPDGNVGKLIDLESCWCYVSTNRIQFV